MSTEMRELFEVGNFLNVLSIIKPSDNYSCGRHTVTIERHKNSPESNAHPLDQIVTRQLNVSADKYVPITSEDNV